MKIYIDNENKCHASNDGTMRPHETSFFDGKCAEFIEGYKCIDRNGEEIFPWKPYAELENAQVTYEHEQLENVTAERDALLTDIAEIVEEIYESDLERINE